MSEQTEFLLLLGEAFQMERKGARIYLEMADKMSDNGIKRLFEKISEEEMKHARIIDNIKKSVEKSIQPERDDDIDSLLSQEADPDNMMFPTLDPFTETQLRKLRGSHEILGALRESVEIEKASYEAYRNLEARFHEYEIKDIMKHLAEEEKKHAKWLVDEVGHLKQTSR